MRKALAHIVQHALINAQYARSCARQICVRAQRARTYAHDSRTRARERTRAHHRPHQMFLDNRTPPLHKNTEMRQKIQRRVCRHTTIQVSVFFVFSAMHALGIFW